MMALDEVLGLPFASSPPLASVVVLASIGVNLLFLIRWARTRGGLALAAAGLSLTLATLVEIAAWPLLPLESVAVVALAYRARAAPGYVEGTALLWLLVAGFGVALTLLTGLLPSDFFIRPG